VIVRVVVVGRVRGLLEEAVGNYETRARHYWKLEVEEVAAGARGRATAPEVMASEGERILERLPVSGLVVALTRDGRGMGSREFASLLEGEALIATPVVAFVVGGAFGLSPAVLNRAQHRISLSHMTLPHEVARLVLAEQLYRAGSILRGEPYHKGRDG